MPRAAGSEASPSLGSLERTLERTVEHLAGGPSSREARALLIEARRLRSVVANWRSIPPPADVLDEMVDRVLQLSTAVGTASPATPPDGPDASPEISIGEAPGAPDPGEYSLDFEPHLYTLETDVSIRPAIPPPAPLPRADAAAAMAKAAAARTDANVMARVAAAKSRLSEPTPPALTAAQRLPAVPFSPPPAPGEEPAPTVPRAAAAPFVVTRSSPPPARASSAPPPRPFADATPARPLSTPPPRPFADATPVRPLSAPPPRPFADATPARPLSAPPPPRLSSEPPPRPFADATPARPLSAPPPPRLSSEPPPRLQSDAPPALFGGPTPPPRPLSVPPEAYPPGEVDEMGVPRTRVAVEAVTLSDPPHPSLVFLNAPYSARADAYRALRRKLAASNNPRVTAVTSAHAGEGKTTFAINFALALRESARGKVLLLETNHRAPSFTKILGFSTPRCFLLQLQDNLEDPRRGWIAAEPLAKLHVMAIDPKVRHEPLLDPVAFGTGMERLKQAGYDFIVVDSPPVIGSVDCNVISDSVEGMILACLTMKSKRKEMRRAVEQIEPAPVLGVVVLDA